MNDVPRRQVVDLVALYSFEPELHDIFVEGNSDRYFIQWFLNDVLGDDTSRDAKLSVYEIDTIDIPDAELDALELAPGGKRDRLIALAHLLEADLPRLTQVTCIADKDYDAVTGKQYTLDSLLFTDYTCVEMYLCNEAVIDKFLSLAVQGFPYSASELLTEMADILQELFIIRMANKTSRLSMSWVSADKDLVIEAGNIKFEKDSFIQRYLAANSCTDKKDLFLRTIESLRPYLKADPRYQIRGHDFIWLLTRYILKYGKKTKLSKRKEKVQLFGNEESVKGALYACLESRELSKEALFITLLKRVSISLKQVTTG